MKVQTTSPFCSMTTFQSMKALLGRPPVPCSIEIDCAGPQMSNSTRAHPSSGRTSRVW